MGIFKRMKQIAAADMHSLLDRCEEPAAMAKQYIREIEEEMEKARDALARQLAAEQHYRILLVQTKETIAKRSRQAEMAVDLEDDDIAELALQEKLRQSHLLAEYEEQRAHAERQIEALQQEIVRMSRLHQELGSKLDAMLIRAQAAQAVGAAAAAAPVFRTEEIMRGISRIESRVRQMEAGSNAARRLSDPHDPLKQWERRDEVRAELERLKAGRQGK